LVRASLEERIEYERTECGSTSDAILRLVTGLASERPIEAAFLPVDSPGFQVARRALGLRRKEDLPIRLLARFPVEDSPGFPLLIGKYLRTCNPEIGAKLVSFFETQNIPPWRWKETTEEKYGNLQEELAPLLQAGEDRP